MAVALNAGIATAFNSPLRIRSRQPSPLACHVYTNGCTRLVSNRRRLVLNGLQTDENAITSDETPSLDSNEDSSKSGEPDNGLASGAKRAPLTARERLRAARVLSRYTEATPKPSKPKMGSQLLNVLKESDRKSNKKSGLPEAPSNMLDDSKRGMPKKGLTFDFPGGADILVIAFSFVFISTVMFATTYVVWKLGAIHFNE